MSTSGLFFRQRRWRPSSFPFPLFFSSYSFLGNTFSNHRQIDLYIINIVNLTPKWSNQEASQTKSSTTNKQRHLRQKTRVNVCDTIFMHYYQMDVVDVAGFITKWTLSTLQALLPNGRCRLCRHYHLMNIVDFVAVITKWTSSTTQDKFFKDLQKSSQLKTTATTLALVLSRNQGYEEEEKKRQTLNGIEPESQLFCLLSLSLSLSL